jgi:small subunit ribosomal protein S9
MVDYIKGLGRRKKSVAHVQLIANGSGKILVNNLSPKKYFPNDIVIKDMLQPLALLQLQDKVDINAKVSGGGFSGQAGAIRYAITRALIVFNSDFRPILKTKKLTTRDARVKERKKYGKYGARRSPQFTKR